MTASIYQRLHLAQLEPGGGLYLAMPYPHALGDQDPADPLWVVDVARDLSFTCRRRRAELADLQTAPPLNRYVTLSLPFLPGMLELSSFNLLANLVYEAIEAMPPEAERTPRDHCLAFAWQAIAAALGQGLLDALHPDPEFVESFCRPILHDQLAASLRDQLAAAGVTLADRASWANPDLEYPL